MSVENPPVPFSQSLVSDGALIWENGRAKVGLLPASMGGGGSSGLADGDYGDVIVSSSGTVITFDTGVVTAFAKTFLDDASAAAVRTTIGAGTSNFNGAFSALSGIPTTLSGYGITDAQGLDAELTALAGLTSAADKLPYFTGSGTASVTTFTSAGRALVDDADATAQRTTLGLGSVATLASDTDGGLVANSDTRVATQKAVKTYIDTLTASFGEHQEVKCATTAALTELSYTNNGGVGDLLTLVAGVVLIDGQAMTIGDRVLVKNQSSAAHNGIWVVQTVGAIGISAVLIRATDFDQEADGIAGALVFVLNGTVNDDTRWECSVTGVITWGTTNLNWSQFLGGVYSADETTLHLAGTTFSIKSPGGATTYLDGTGAYSTPAGTGASAANVKDYRRSPIYLPVTLAGIDDEFDDQSFSGSWTAVNSGSHNPTITEDDDMCSMLHPGSDAAAELHAWMQAVTVNTNNYIEAWVSFQCKTNTAVTIGVIMADGTTYNAGAQVYFAFFNLLSTSLSSFTKYNTAGTATNNNLNQTTGVGTGMGIRLQYLGSNNWAGFVSIDGISWLNVTGTLSRTMTPTAVGFFCSTWGSANPTLFTFRRVRFG